MTVRFYMNDQGHILDNKKHPVTHPMMMRPVFRSAPMTVGEPIPRQCHFETEIFRAYSIKPDDGAR